MDLILLISFVSLILIGFLFIKFHRFEKSIHKEEDRIFSKTKKQTELVTDAEGRDLHILEQSLQESRKRMLHLYESQMEKEAKRIEKELDARLSEFADTVFSRIDAHVSESLSRMNNDLALYKKQQIEELDEKIEREIKKAAKASIARGLSLTIHEEMVARALKEAIDEINIK
jgi:hypothetical protein